jgi:hypothetical protein
MFENRKLRDGFVGAAAMMATFAAPACAQEDIRTTAQASPASYSTEAPANDGAEQEAWMEAQDYSLENVAISYVIYGRTSRYSNDRIAQELNALFYAEGLSEDEVRVWQANPDQIGVGIGMYVDGAGLSSNTLSLSEAVAHIPRAVELYREHAPIMRERLEEERRSRQELSNTPN